ncbi:PfkB family carbohydrate kinase [Tropicimonas sp.]|uniref:PfkB family carbohydrate kinase n=1 Tax=Tropicimonas sp. TaxID=2067044 RepID=UPI003A8C1323
MLCVFGSINVDHVMRVHEIVRPGETVLAKDLVLCQGGKDANQAVAAARVGASVAMIGAVGRDENGESARLSLVANGVEDAGVATTGHPTGCAFISLDDRGENAITVLSGANASARLRNLSDSCTTLVCQMELPTDAVVEALEIACGNGCRTILNLAPVPAVLTPAQAKRLVAATEVLIVNEGGFVYLVAVLDWFSRKVLAWRLSATLETEPCVEALKEAMHRHGKPEIMNTDQGSQFTSIDFIRTLKTADIQISMDGKGAWRDNVFVERLWRTIKYEEVYLRAYDSVSVARESLRRYLKFYNSRRPHSSLDGQTPDQAYLNPSSQTPVVA